MTSRCVHRTAKFDEETRAGASVVRRCDADAEGRGVTANLCGPVADQLSVWRQAPSERKFVESKSAVLVGKRIVRISQFLRRLRIGQPRQQRLNAARDWFVRYCNPCAEKAGTESERPFRLFRIENVSRRGIAWIIKDND